MSEKYIRIRDAVDALDELRVNGLDAENGLLLLSGIAAASDTIESLEPADVAPVIHGRWVNGSCDKCGKHAPYYLMSSTYYDGDFCPNCGAKMDGAE